MLTTLETVKARLAIPDLIVEFDDLLTTALTALSARFERETNRTLTRTANSTFEFDPCETEIIPPCYPVESVSKFETKSNASFPPPLQARQTVDVVSAGGFCYTIPHVQNCCGSDRWNSFWSGGCRPYA